MVPVTRSSAPDRLHMFDHSAPARPQPRFDPAHRLGADEHDAGDLAVDVELELLGRGVPDAHRAGALVPGKLWELELRQAPLSADPVHDLDVSGVARTDAEQEVAERQRLLRVSR